jgi:outer membrane biogenesis lipoprotein LolB
MFFVFLNTSLVSAFPLYGCGNNGQGDQVDNLYSIRVKSTQTQHKLEHLHLYQINGRIRLDKVEPIQSKSEQKYQQFCVKQKIGGKIV